MKLFKKSPKYVKFIENFKKKLKKIKENKDFLVFLDFSVYLIIYGFILNLSLLIFGLKLNILNILSLGASYWFIDNKIISLLRRLWFRK